MAATRSKLLKVYVFVFHNIRYDVNGGYEADSCSCRVESVRWGALGAHRSHLKCGMRDVRLQFMNFLIGL